MGKTVVLGITGSIAAYKAAELAGALKKKGVAVRAILTRAGAEFITPLTLETITGAPVALDMFRRDAPFEIEHISLAKAADCFLVAPASADFLAKAACGIADDMLTTTLLATTAPVVVAPAMNVNMYRNPVVQENIGKLKARGFHFVAPESGMLACGDEGEGRLAAVETILARVMELLYPKRDFEGKRMLVSAGPTVERLDPVRYLTNRSTGRMGYAIAQALAERGAQVTLISGPTQLAAPEGIKRVDVVSAADMLAAIEARFDDCDGLVMAAAPADFTPREAAEHKLKKSGAPLSLELVPTADILKTLLPRKQRQIVAGFAAETRDWDENARKKLNEKGLDLIACNDVTRSDAGFAADTNQFTLHWPDGRREDGPLLPKLEAAHWLLDRLAVLL